MANFKYFADVGGEAFELTASGDDRCGSCGSLAECMDEIAVRIEESE